jgi:predicted RNA binding protein YcfA (HicA-like mRNA interferase family)
MVSLRMSWLPRVESRKHQREGYQEQKNHGSHDAVGQNDGMVLVNGGEAISHSCQNC